MSAMAHEAMPTDEEILLESFLALETPEGFKAELVEGEIVVSPAPDGDHQDAIDVIVYQVFGRSTEPMQQSGNSGLLIKAGGPCPKNHLIPDLVLAPRERRILRGAPSWMRPDGVAMVVEVTSLRPSVDRKVKRHCYARAGIPLYLLVDRDEAKVVLHSEPSGDDYARVLSVAFGEPLALPEPFGFELETSEFF
ncbi:Uma2 family endonuclease [Streptacidiphilus jiangxiensis]|uniref:Endonuclease, Uma2 family (Restriction endonuclease fold) n=1 Tax=Streptacidiphilus jiangxiensis TaxID=235985 RepID=A0A1H7VXU4_STRJI|nr:Uma2 family endonuclease [Streptacidiphilus jiangxiensis]SEM14030.1 Endonuclease, Uma2 family (restriction endonuclease fold) [Streptacidiphilus jiangxiensis]